MAELSKAIARLMEERSQAAAATPQHRQLFDRIRERVAPGERAAAESFSRLLIARAPQELVEGASDDALAALCVSAYRFIAPAGEEPRVRVFNPEFGRDGWDAPVTIVETLVSDRPFIVDTVREAVHQAGGGLRVLLHPILGSERDPQRALTAITPPERSLRHESFVHAEIEPLAEPAARAALEDDLRQRVGDLLLATNDYQAMRQATAVLANELRSSRGARPSEPPAEEIAAFLDWLTQGNFVFLGYRAYTLSGEGDDAVLGVQPGSGLGLLRKERSTFAQRPRLRDLDPALRRRIQSGPPVVVTKTTSESPIHRRARMDYIGVRTYDAQGRVSGEKRLIGLFTSRAYNEESAELPLLRRKLQRVLQAEGALDGSHDYREIIGLFNSTPKEHLLAGTAEEIHKDIRAMRAASGDDVRVAVRPDQLERGMFVLVVFPRESFSAELRRRIEAMVKRASSGVILDQHVAMEETEHVRLHFYVAAAPEAVRNVRAEALQAEVQELLRTWDDRLRDALEANGTMLQPRALARQYAGVFPPEYKASTDVAQAVGDIRAIEKLVATGQPQVEVLNPERSKHTTLKLYVMNEEVVLSDFLPVLENLGLRVYADDPLAVTLPAGGTVHLHAFEVLDATPRRDAAGAAAAAPADEKLDLRRVGARLADAILAHRGGRLVDDILNSLVLSAGLTWQQVQVLRAYGNHVAQSGLASRAAVLSALASQPETARAIWDYFCTKFDPADRRLPRERLNGPLTALETAFVASLEKVASITEDRILRALFATVVATVRTNVFHRGDQEPVAFKLDPQGLEHLVRPRPRHEIFVYGPQTEGVHLRAGKVARGGLRLSDRRDDYRTEVLDLMKTQVVKNAVIIPTGAKGGFVVRRRGNAAPTQTEIVAAYRSFVASLLALTDNIVQGRVVAPPGVIYDEPDPYLVVAADKGTSAFSDIANEVAVRAGFWLGDAFASGGSNGYDHKRLGITARGAWESVRRHFREMGRDADHDAISVIGIGDMGGDVFGNGLLLSENLRLRAAFNHQHIFLDPDPDSALAYAERARLFALPRSTWDDYARDAISAGGGVFPRAAKKIELTPEVRGMLGTESEALSGEDLVGAVLAMDADLLWNGGIGTYVKAAAESHAEVGDATNDAVRVSANQLRVRVVAEGGNLGFTQAARVEYALAGGRINSDAVDNAGGVNMSDHEVNLKILFGPLLEAEEIGLGERNRLLAGLAGDVTEQVLATNRDQARALMLDQMRSQNHLNQFRDVTLGLEREGLLDRALHRLPEKEALRRRRGQYLGVTRPELAVVLAHLKLHLQQRLLASPVPDDPQVERYLLSYFPRSILERHRGAVRNHRLRREIIVVQLVNLLVDTLGATFVQRIVADTGCSEVDVMRAFGIAAVLSDLDRVLADIAAAAPPPEVESKLLFTLEPSLERACKWLILTQDRAEPMGEVGNRFLAPVFELAAALPAVLGPEGQQRYREALTGLAAQGIGELLAARLLVVRHLADLLEIAHLAAEMDTPVRLTAETFYRASALLDLDWVRNSLSAAAGEDRWEQRAVEGMLENLVYARRVLAREILTHRGAGPADRQIDHCIEEYTREHAAEIDEVRRLIQDVKSAAKPTIAAMVVIMRELGRLTA